MRTGVAFSPLELPVTSSTRVSNCSRSSPGSPSSFTPSVSTTTALMSDGSYSSTIWAWLSPMTSYRGVPLSGIRARTSLASCSRFGPTGSMGERSS